MARLRALRAFVLIAELESFRKAAAHLNTTQPAISARIRGLEEYFGRPLLIRDPRGVRLTREGMDVLRYAKPIVELTDRLTTLFESKPRLTGTVRIGVIDTIIASWMIDLFERLKRDHPEMNFEIRADTSVNLIEDLRNGQIDIGLVMGPVEDEGIENIDLGTYPMAWVANPRFFPFKAPVELTDLADYSIISYPRGSKPYRMIERSLAAVASGALQISSTNSVSALIRLVCAGAGIAALPPVLIPRELADGTLDVVPVDADFPGLSCHASYYTASGSAAPGIIARLAQEEADRFWARHKPAV